MAGVADLLSGANVSQALVRSSQLGSKPQFELQFNMLQNTIIDRLNDKIEEALAEDKLKNSKVDVFLLKSAKKLDAFKQGIEALITDNTRNIYGMSALNKHLDKMQTALENSDTDAFNTELEKLNNTTGKLKVTNGVTVGILTDDGIQKLRTTGVVRFTDDGKPTKATSLSDFADSASAQESITAARNELGNIAQALVFKQQGAEAVRYKTAEKLNDTILQINSARAADQAAKAEEISKLRESYGQLLNILSLAFESNQVLTKQLGAKLFEAPELEKGSIISIFS